MPMMSESTNRRKRYWLRLRASSASLWRVMSLEIPSVPTTWPSRSCRGTFVEEDHVSCPSAQISFSSKLIKALPVCRICFSSSRAF